MVSLSLAILWAERITTKINPLGGLGSSRLPYFSTNAPGSVLKDIMQHRYLVAIYIPR